MPTKPPRRRPGDGQDVREPPWDTSSLDKPPDISKMVTAYLVPPGPLRRVRAGRLEQLIAHRAAGDHLREQQRGLVREMADWQNQLQLESSADRRAEIQLQIDNLWAMWSELERQVRAHKQAARVPRELNSPPAPEQDG